MARFKLLDALSICLCRIERLGMKVCARTLQARQHSTDMAYGFTSYRRSSRSKDDIAERLAWLLVATFAKDLATKFHKHGI